ncbi:MAG: dTDP-4-dehydrorhamnose reductase [bacterium]|jgi:dTDP-4-dehydrorhamnose reductase
MKNILLIGHDGQVGFELQRALAPLGHVTAVCYPAIDFSDPDSIVRIVREAKPNLIVNAAAYTAVDKAESEPVLCRKLNAEAPTLLAEEALRLGAGLIHYSTDFVFDGTKQHPYVETDLPHPLSVYGATKLEGDRAIQASGVPHLIFRLAWIYGLRGKNFLLTMRRLANEGKPLRVVSDQIGCPTWCRTIADATATALSNVRAQDGSFDLTGVSGLYHCVCAGQTSWHGFTRAFTPADIPVVPITTSDYPTPARRPSYSVMSCNKFSQTFGSPLPNWEQALNDCLRS